MKFELENLKFDDWQFPCKVPDIRSPFDPLGNCCNLVTTLGHMGMSINVTNLVKFL